jgi:uracil-DNA glycosylase family 4
MTDHAASALHSSLPHILDVPSSLAALNQSIIDCRRCPRLVAWREESACTKRRACRNWDDWGRPVPGFGDPNARLLIVGLAPAAHGGNRTGRVFTGDSSGDFLFAALHRAGFANQPIAVSKEDGLILSDVYITAACRCAPPANKPTREELDLCRPYLLAELRLLSGLQGIVALGRIGMEAAVAAYRSLGYAIPAPVFGHGVVNELGCGLPWLLASYHPSQQNTHTGRLTPAMFDAIWHTARERLDH